MSWCIIAVCLGSLLCCRMKFFPIGIPSIENNSPTPDVVILYILTLTLKLHHACVSLSLIQWCTNCLLLLPKITNLDLSVHERTHTHPVSLYLLIQFRNSYFFTYYPMTSLFLMQVDYLESNLL